MKTKYIFIINHNIIAHINIKIRFSNLIFLKCGMIRDIYLDKAEKCLNGMILKILGSCAYTKEFLLAQG